MKSKAAGLVALFMVAAVFAMLLCGVAMAQERLVVASGTEIPKNIIAAFEKQNPGTKVEVLLSPSWQFDDKLAVLFSTGERIDLLVGWSVYKWAYYALNGGLRDLTPYVQADKSWLDTNRIFPQAYETGRIGNTLAGINIELRMGWSVFYNDQLIQAAGLPRPPASWDDRSWDWQTFASYAQRIAKFDGAGVPLQHGLAHFDDDLAIFNLAWAWNTDVLPAEAYATGKTNRVHLAQRSMVDAFESLFKVEEAAASTGDRNTFFQGKTGMWLGVGDFREYEFPWGVTRMPIGPAGPVPLATWASFWGVPAMAENADGAWKFIKFMLTDGNMLRDDSGQWWRNGITVNSWVQRFRSSRNSVLTQSQLLDFYIQGLTSYTRMSPREIVLGAGEIAKVVYNEMRTRVGVNKPNLWVGGALMNAETRLNAILADY